MEQPPKEGKALMDRWCADILKRFEEWQAARKREDRGYRIEGLQITAGDLAKPV